MIEQRLKNGRASVGIIGLGYVGLPLAVEFARAGLPVLGFEVDAAKIRSVNAGRSYIPDIPSTELGRLVRAGKIGATADYRRLSAMDAVVICVPTPLRKSRDPDISYIVAAVDKVAPALRKGQLIVLESTTYPGTTREILLPRLARPGWKVGRDYFVAFSPERVDPGNKKFGIRNTPKIVGGMTAECTRLAALLYSRAADRVVSVSSAEAAEMVKLLENTFRAVNIGLVNEVALMCERLKLDAWEVIDAAATKPFGFMPFYPGPGIGGHCIPLDPHYLSWKLKTLNFYARFIELAGEINSKMPEVLVERVAHGLNGRKKALRGAKVLVLGAAYKKDISDVRESPALDVMALLAAKGVSLRYHDPFVPSLNAGGKTYKSVPLTDALLSSQDAVVVVTDHSAFDMGRVVAKSSLVVDSRNATRGLKSPKIVKL